MAEVTKNHPYDLLMLLDTQAEEAAREQAVTEAQKLIEAQGEFVSRDPLGVAQLDFKIRHRTEADRILLRFKGPAELVAELDRTLKIADPILRFRIIKDGAPLSELPTYTPSLRKADEDDAPSMDDDERAERRERRRY